MNVYIFKLPFLTFSHQYEESHFFSKDFALSSTTDSINVSSHEQNQTGYSGREANKSVLLVIGEKLTSAACATAKSDKGSKRPSLPLSLWYI